MFKSKVVTKENYREIVLKRAIISCWIILAICFVIKIFGGNFFTIVCNLEGFNKFCEFCDSTFIVYIFQFIIFGISSFIIFRCIDYKCSIKKTFIKVSIYYFVWILKHLQSMAIITINIYLMDAIDFVVIYLLSVIFDTNKKYKFIKPILFLLLLFIFTMISAITKNIGIKDSLPNSSLISLIFMIDYYIMLILTYLYQKRRYDKWVHGESSTGSVQM